MQVLDHPQMKILNLGCGMDREGLGIDINPAFSPDIVADVCKPLPIKELKEDFEGQPIDKDVSWEQYLCEECYEQIWNNLMDDCCPICRTEPCKRGGDCWINPWPHIMYLCYVAPRVETTNPEQTKLATPIPPNTKVLGILGGIL